ncbi:dUTP diphosphatase [Streptomyces sp. INA 01156]
MSEPRRGALRVLLRRVDPEVPLPAYEHPGDAGADLRTTEACELAPGSGPSAHRGVCGPARGVRGLRAPAIRSGRALRRRPGECPGTVDAGYRGEIKVIVVNLDPREAVRFERFDRIAQLVVQQVERVRFVPVAELPRSVRAEGGFGSTGGHAAVEGKSGTSVQAAEGGTAGGNRYASVVSDREGQ